MIKLLDNDVIEAGDEFRCVFKYDYEFSTPFEKQRELDWCIVHQGMIGKSVKEYTDKHKSMIYSFRRPSNSICIITKYIFNKFLNPKFDIIVDLLMFDLNINNDSGPIHIKTTKLYKILPKSIAKEIHEFCKMTGQYIPPTNQNRPAVNNTVDLVCNSTLYKMLASGESVTFKKIGALLAIMAEKDFIKKSETGIMHAQDLKSDIKTNIERLLRKVRS